MSPSNVRWYIDNLPPLGLQELLIAMNTIRRSQKFTVHPDGMMYYPQFDGFFYFDLTKNLHSQSDAFYESLLPLLP